MPGQRREHQLSIVLNKRRFARVVIDPHYQDKHSDITDQIILELVKLLDDNESDAVAVKDGFTYVARELNWQGKVYRIVLTYGEEDFLGVVNAFRVKEKKS